MKCRKTNDETPFSVGLLVGTKMPFTHLGGLTQRQKLHVQERAGPPPFQKTEKRSKKITKPPVYIVVRTLRTPPLHSVGSI